MAGQMYYDVYRKTSIGLALIDAIDQLVLQQRVEPQLAIVIMAHYDKAIADVLDQKVKARMNFKGRLATYRFCDDVWSFIIKDVKFTMDKSEKMEPLEVEKVKIVCNNSSRASAH